jgi:hypothetical protein
MGGSVQGELQFRQHGGKRHGAGRKRVLPGKKRVPHRKRPDVECRFPLLVTKRLRRDARRLRNFELCKVLRKAFALGCKKGSFRICQFSIQGNHVHLICEAASARALGRGIQGWAVRVAHGVNDFFEREGGLFDDRYHAEILRTPSQTRNALCYVLQNARRHGEHIDPRFHGADPFSSAWWFDGWEDDTWKLGLDPPEEHTVAEPESWLLRVGWQRSPLGRIAIDEVPAAARA